MANSQPFEPMQHSHLINKKFCFLTVLALAFFFLFIALGLWQLDRGYEKQLMLENMKDKDNQPALSLQALSKIPATEEQVWQKVELTGQFDSKHFFLIENKTYQHQVGFHVVMPFKTTSGTFLVNRGWLAKSAATLAPISDNVTIRGHLYRPKHNRFIYTNFSEETAWPQKVLEVDIPTFEQKLNYKLYPMVVNLQSDSPSALKVQPMTAEMLMPERHWGYAAQWFSFAAILLGIYCTLTFKAWRTSNAKS